MPLLPWAALAVAASLFSTAASANCYVVYGPGDEIVYRDAEPPVDLSRPLHQTVPQALPGGRLVFSPDSFGCDVPINRLATLQARAAEAAVPAARRAPRADRS